MKKILIAVLFMFICLPVLAEYKPIPKELSAQYKKEIEQVIKTQIPIAKKILIMFLEKLKKKKMSI